jgi:hypothetical protein
MLKHLDLIMFVVTLAATVLILFAIAQYLHPWWVRDPAYFAAVLGSSWISSRFHKRINRRSESDPSGLPNGDKNGQNLNSKRQA